MNLAEELECLRRAKTGDAEAVGALFKAITPRLYGYLLNTLRAPEVAEDVLQQSWMKAIGALPRFEERGVRFSAWLFAIAKNECRQHWRKPTTESLELLMENGFKEPCYRQHGLEEKILIDQLMLKMPPTDQELLRLRYIADLSFRDIASILNISSLTARVRLHRALKAARTLLSHSL